MSKRSAKQTPLNNKTSDELKDATRGLRLQKVLAEAGIASRRDCEQFITDGRVRVNGRIVTELPLWVDPAVDRIEVDEHLLPRKKKAQLGKGGRKAGKTYVMVNKPRGVISTNADPLGRKRVVDLVKAPIRARLFPVGRLDGDSTGLILLTDDGELANRLTHPRYEVSKQYQVSVKGRLREADLVKLRKGLLLTHQPASTQSSQSSSNIKRASMESVRITSYQTDRSRGDRTTLAITLREGQNREIRRLLAKVGIKVRRLKRVAIGPLKLKGLAVGQWRMLTAPELRALRKAAGLK